MSADPSHSSLIEPQLQLVAWEITRSCNLHCAHCRASSSSEEYSGELSSEEALHLVDQIREAGNPIIILTGGEPLMRTDVYSIAEYAKSKGLRVVMGSNGTLVTPQVAARLKASGLSRVSVSLDFPTAEKQDKFRGQQGAFEAALSGIRSIRKSGIEVQINCTLTRLNIACLNDLLSLALHEGAVAFHPFFLVPTGRGKGLSDVELSAGEYESALNWIYDKQLELGDKIFFKPTDAPHYLRILSQRGASPATGRHHGGADSVSRGCMAGSGFCFISHTGRVQGCGYLDLEAGNIRNQPFGDIWRDSPLFKQLRDLSAIKGKCGACEYKRICGGCRARALETTGDHLESEPYCIYQPRSATGERVNAE
ncbi:MAG: radical SAM protein [Dehalococcoidia bacterium]|jgi:MoaA/NifB/PqqE/SkfB family radical SAM enzyme